MKLFIKNLVATILILFISIFVHSQEIDPLKNEITKTQYNTKDYPEGQYETLDDFLNIKVTSNFKLRRQGVNFFDDTPIHKDSIRNQIFFFKIIDGMKFKKAFAISYEGNVYVQQRYLHEFAKKGDKNEIGDNENSYHRVLKDGNFFYMEGPFANKWAKGFAYGSGGAVGATIGASLNKLKGVIFDFDKKEVDFIKNCNDYNEFLLNYSIETIDCKNTEFNILIVRKTIDKVIK